MADLAPGREDPPLFERVQHPAVSTKGVVVVVHGYAEHSGRYGHLADTLTDAGFRVVLYDHRGFGQSPGRPAYVAHMDRLVADLSGVVARTRAQWPDQRIFLFGHSMGGLVSALYCLKSPGHGVDGLVLSSPLLRTLEAPLLQRVARLVGMLAPRLPTITLDRSALSRDPLVVSEAESDPMNYHGRIPARTGAEFIRGMRYLEAEGHRLDLPLLLLHGTADRITDPAGSSELYARASSNHKQLSLFEGAYHETFNEPEGDRVLRSVAEWLTELTADD